MGVELSIAEKRFLKAVLDELKNLQISKKKRENIQDQIIEHIQEAREHGEDSLIDLGDAPTFVRDFLEVNEVDLHSEIIQLRTTKVRRGTLLTIGLGVFTLTFLILQLLFTMFLTQSFNPNYSNAVFEYNILFRISDNPWWNALLLIISTSSSILITTLLLFFIRKTKGKLSV
ncbi:hypothetical protein [Fredinandcohnia quinoae]|uniref:DUF1700 domain-containing protein n=1 Tax=Fredinandcohnia quinoae TaxID=2918902 RepID=A0AAW5E704_9BACI|nr:hypothetical protein [Fredinandcohnia sp. SECRCQ15]MCH1624564.1 hypothetical protein [Fredinandcohnia sp. SECRCQ15]